jgi:tetratricopeptide (TPR) repeat protein
MLLFSEPRPPGNRSGSSRMTETRIDLQTLASEFLSLAREKLTGTYKVIGTDGRERQLLILDGLIVDVDAREELSLLAAAILDGGWISERDLRKARKVQAKSGVPLGAVLLQQAEVPEEELLAAVRARIVDEICNLFASEIRETSFSEHARDERLEGFGGELSESLEIYADPEELVLEAARRMDRWDLIEANFSFLRDVHYATPGAFKYFREEESYPVEVVIIGLIDGRRDVSEVIAEAVSGIGSTIDSFQAFAIIRALISRGELELINPVQMFQLGGDFAAAGHHEKALKLYLRASERGLDDFDLGWKIAATLEALGRTEEAAGRYQEFAEKCLIQFRPDDAIRSFRKACDLQPENFPRQGKLLRLLIQEGRKDEALAYALLAAGRHAAAGRAPDGLELLLDLRRRGFKDERLGEKIVDLAEKCGDQATVRREREQLALDFCALKDVEKALEVYQRMFCDGNTSPEVRLKLVDLHLEKGDRKRALEHVESLLAQGEGERIRDEAVLRRLHHLVCDLKPGNLRSHRWLVDHYLRIGDREAALGVLRGLVGHLEREGEHHEVVLVIRQLSNIDPDCLDHLWKLAAAYAKIGKSAAHIEELRKIARLALHRKDPQQAERAHTEIIKTSPFDVESRKALADLCEARGDSAKAVAWFKEVALLDILSGNLPEAQDYCRRLLVIDPRDPEIVYKLADLCRTLGDDQKAVEQLIKAARIHIENSNLGIAREALANALQLGPANAESIELKRAIEELEARLSAPAPEPAPAASIRVAEDAPAPGASAKKSIAGITARLRNLRSGGSGGERSPEDVPPRAPIAEVSGAAEVRPELSRAQAAAAPAAEGRVPDGPVDVPTTKPTRAGGTGVSNAASRLKALAGGVGKAPGNGGTTAPAATPATAAMQDAADGGNGRTPKAPTNPEVLELERLRKAAGGVEKPEKPAEDPDRIPKASKLGGSVAALARLKKAVSAAPADPKPAEAVEANAALQAEA